MNPAVVAMSADDLPPRVVSILPPTAGDRDAVREISDAEDTPRCSACGSDAVLSERTIARSPQLSAGAVNGYLSRARRAGIAWLVPDDLYNEQLERLLFPLPPDLLVDQRSVPKWAVVHRELRWRT
jgi:hypothetical protein